MKPLEAKSKSKSFYDVRVCLGITSMLGLMTFFFQHVDEE